MMRAAHEIPHVQNWTPITACFGPDGITICDPNRASEGADKGYRWIYLKLI